MSEQTPPYHVPDESSPDVNHVVVEYPFIMVNGNGDGKFETVIFEDVLDHKPAEIGILFADMARIVSTALAQKSGEQMGASLAELVEYFNAEIERATAIVQSGAGPTVNGD